MPVKTPHRQPSKVILNRLAGARQSLDRSRDRAEVLSAIREGRDIPARAVDVIVDRLLRELSW